MLKILLLKVVIFTAQSFAMKKCVRIKANQRKISLVQETNFPVSIYLLNVIKEN